MVTNRVTGNEENEKCVLSLIFSYDGYKVTSGPSANYDHYRTSIGPLQNIPIAVGGSSVNPKAAYMYAKGDPRAGDYDKAVSSGNNKVEALISGKWTVLSDFPFVDKISLYSMVNFNDALYVFGKLTLLFSYEETIL